MGGVAAALTLGSATTFWAQATIANIRMPTLFFAALALYALARFAALTAENAESAEKRNGYRARIRNHGHSCFLCEIVIRSQFHTTYEPEA
jgi:hypothetical protein